MMVAILFKYNDAITNDATSIIDELLISKNFKKKCEGFYIGDIGHNVVDLSIIIVDLNKMLKIKNVVNDISYLRFEEEASFLPLLNHI